MGSLTISSTAFDAAGEVLAKAGGFLGDASQASAGDAGHSELVAKGQEAASAWQSAIAPMTEAVTIDSKQCIAAGQEFGRVDEALAGALTGGMP